MLTLLLFFLFPPKNLLIWSIRPGFFFFLPSPKALCPEVLAVAMLAAAAVGGVDLSVYSVVLFQAIPKLTVPKPVSAAPSGWFAAHLTLRGCLWRCHPLGPRAPWDILRVRLVRVGGLHWWCPWFWLSSRHSLELQWLCQSLPPSAWARPLFLSPSASPRPQGQQGLSLSLNSHPDAKQPEALWGHCCIGPIYLLHALCLNWMYSHQIKKRKDYGVKETKTCEHRPIICLHSNKINLRWLCTLHLLRFGVFKPKPLKSSSYFSLWLTGEQDLCHGLENCSFML